MAHNRFSRLDELDTPNSYVTPSTEQDLAYTAYFREVCKRYNIDFATADADERKFAMRMVDKGFIPKRA